MTDQEIIDLVRDGKNEKPIKWLYQEFPKIEKLILQSGGNKQLAEEIFNDSLLLLLEKVREDQFTLTSKLTTYFYGINRFLLLNELRKNKHANCSLEWSDTLIVSGEDLGYDFDKEQKLNMMERVLKQISAKCQAILELFYFKKRSMEQIARELEYSSVNSAKTQKFKCLEHASKMAFEMIETNSKKA